MKIAKFQGLTIPRDYNKATIAQRNPVSSLLPQTSSELTREHQLPGYSSTLFPRTNRSGTLKSEVALLQC